MRRVIDGKLFDTDKATRLCGLNCTAYPSDFAWHDTSLYRSKGGRYFLAGQGGPSSMWAQPAYGGGRGEGRGIRVLDDDEARDYAERAGLDADAMIAAGFPVEDA